MNNDSQLLTQQFREKQPGQSNDRGKRSGLAGTLFAVLILGVAVAAFLSRQWIVDQYTVMQFTPSTELVGLADRSGLNDKGKFYLYASRSQIDDRAEFNTACGQLMNEKTVVLGCYTGTQKRIYIFRVNDPNLDGVEDVTAAHEMLHAAYDRLPASEKERIGVLLVAQQQTITDPRLLALIKDYQETEPTEVVNELHSIFGTEVRTLSPELETYYAQYFTDRNAVVTLKEKYEKVFTDLAAEQTRLVEALNALANDVNTRQVKYQTDSAKLNADIEAFNVWAQGGTATRAQYDTRRGALQGRMATLNVEREAINAEIDEYNVQKAKLDTLNIQAESLNQSIDSKLTPTTQGAL